MVNVKRFVIGDIHGRFNALKEVLKLSKFNRDDDLLIVLGDVVDGGSNTNKVIDELLTIKNLVFIKGNHDCIDKETEIYTNNGWKNFKSIDKRDKCLSFDRKLKWSKINKIIRKKYEGNMITFKSSHVDMCVTPNHRVFGRRRNNLSYEYFNAKNIMFERLIIPVASSFFNYDYDIDDIRLQIVAWLLTDGCIYRNKKTHIGSYIIYQSKEKTYLEIKELLDKLGYKYTINKRTKFVKKINNVKLKKEFHIEKSFRLLKESASDIKKYINCKKKFPKWLYKISDRQFNIFLNVIKKADASIHKHCSAFTLYGKYEFLEHIQILCHMHNYRAVLKQNNRNEDILNISFKKEEIVLKERKNEKKYKDIVWCIDTEVGNFLMKRNGKIAFTGNCWFINYTFKGTTPAEWINQGGANTLNSYGGNVKPSKNLFKEPRSININGIKIPKKHVEFFAKGLYYFEYDGMLFVHGGFDPSKPITEQNPESLMWDRNLIKYADLNTIPKYDKVFIGHTTTQHIERNWVNFKCRQCKQEWENKIESFDEMEGNPVCPECKSKDIFQSLGCVQPIKIGNLFCLDTGGGWNGKITLMDIDSEKFWQSELQEPAITNNK